MLSCRLNSAVIFFVLSVVLFDAPQAFANGHEWQQFSQENNDEILTLRLGRTRARIDVASQECIGEFWGEVTRYDDHIKLHDPNRASRRSAPECEFTLWPLEGGGYRIDESFDCLAYHGALCDLSGFVYPVIDSTIPAEAPVAPSFSCASNLNQAEQSVCDDLALSKVDRLLSTIYQSTISLAADGLLLQDPTNVQANQRSWVQDRNVCGTDQMCLASAYHIRLSELTELWIGLSFDEIWPLLSSDHSLGVVKDEYQRTILFATADDIYAHTRSEADSVYENILVFDRDGHLIHRTFDDVNSACDYEFSYNQEPGSDHSTLRRALVCNRQVVSDGTYELDLNCIRLNSLYQHELGGHGRQWSVSSASLCTEDNLQRGADLIWAWDASVEPLSFNEPDESSIALFAAAQNFMKFSENFINYWLSPSIQAVSETELGTNSCPASELTVNYVKLLNFYHNTLLTSDDDISESEYLSFEQPTLGYTADVLPGNDDINSRFSELLDDYRRNEVLARPLLIMTLNVLNQNGSAVELIDDLLLAYEWEQNPSEYPGSFYPCNAIKVSSGPLYDITYWDGFDTFGFWQRRRSDGTAELVFELLSSLKQELEE